MKKTLLLTIAFLLMFAAPALSCKVVLRAVDTFAYSNTDCIDVGNPDFCCTGPGVGTCTAEQAFIFKTGFVVKVRDDSYVFKSSDLLPIHWRVTVNNATVEQCSEYIQQRLDTGENPLGLRKHKLNPNSLPAQSLAELLDTGEITVNRQTVVKAFELILD